MLDSEGELPPDCPNPVDQYKILLRRILENRPSGTRLRLAQALGKNRSFVSQISNPAYATPIPAPHLKVIFEICHFSPDQRRAFLEAYGRAHPRRLARAQARAQMRRLTLPLPDLGSVSRNEQLDRLLINFVEGVVGLIQDHKR